MSSTSPIEPSLAMMAAPFNLCPFIDIAVPQRKSFEIVLSPALRRRRPMIRTDRLGAGLKTFSRRPEAGGEYGTRRNRPVGIIFTACSVAISSVPYPSALRRPDKILSVRVGGPAAAAGRFGSQTFPRPKQALV